MTLRTVATRSYGRAMPQPLALRLAQRIDRTSSPLGCWLWTGRTNRGYGVTMVDGKPRKAHRVVYELFVGPIPDGLVLDHAVCANPTCVNPDHMDPVTSGENTRRAQRQDECSTHGTPYDYRNADGWGVCRACGRESARRYYHRTHPGGREYPGRKHP